MVGFGLLEQAPRPFPPAFGHLGNGNQPLEPVRIGGVVGTEKISDRQIVKRLANHADLIPGAQIALDDDSQVSPGSLRVYKTAHKPPILHPYPKSPTGYSRLRDLKNGASDLPSLSDERIIHLDISRRKVFPELTVRE